MEYIKIDYTNNIYPKRLLEIKKYPKELYIVGNYKLLNAEKKLAIIGSRDCTEYGRGNATYFAKELSKKGICIVSGMALGIDTASHIGALENIGKTIAVIGGGFNKIYPKENEWLFHKILQTGGCIITEYAPNVESDKANFPKRNRIISGLSDAVLVVEAEYRSGTSITANYAKEQKRTIMCLPSNIDNRCGIGTNKLIQEGAKLITKPREIEEIIFSQNILNSNITAIKKDKNQTTNLKFQNNKSKKLLPKEYESIYKLIEEKPIHINDISKTLKQNISEVSTALTMLELEGLVEQLPGNRFKIK